MRSAAETASACRVRSAQLADALGQVLFGGSLQELALDAKGPTDQLHLGVPLVVDLVQVVAKEPSNMPSEHTI